MRFFSSWVPLLRQEMRPNLDCLASVYLRGSAVGDSGMPVETLQLVASDLPCALNQWGSVGTEGQFAGSIVDGLKWVVTFEHTEGWIDARHNLVVSGYVIDVPWVRNLEVVKALQPASNTVMIQVLCDG